MHPRTGTGLTRRTLDERLTAAQPHRTGPIAAPSTSSDASTSAVPGWRSRWHRLTQRAHAAAPDTLLALMARFSIAGIFFLSGRTKVEGLLAVTDNAVALFADEYRLPWIDPTSAAHLAAWAEHLFPALLVLGLATRLSALALLGMTAVIQVFVYPDAWATHLSWATLLLYLVARGPGSLSADRALRID